LTLSIDWHREQVLYSAVDPAWRKWRASDPTSAYWYTPERFERLVAGYIGHDHQNGQPRTVRELVKEFEGLTGTQKQKAVLSATGLSRTPLSALARADGSLDSETIARLLTEMQRNSRPVKPTKLGVIGERNLAARFEELGCDMETFRYRRALGIFHGVPWLVETAFAWNEDLDERRLITGIHWSPKLSNPFRELDRYGNPLDSVLDNLEAEADQPIVFLIHFAYPGVGFSDQGKSSVLLGEWEEP
jgi:hypothetical protein